MNWQEIKHKVVLTEPVDPEIWFDRYHDELKSDEMSEPDEVKEMLSSISSSKRVIWSLMNCNEPEQFWFMCGPESSEGGFDSGADVYKELTELFSDITNLLPEYDVEIGWCEDTHTIKKKSMQAISGFPKDDASAEKELREFIAIRLAQMGAVENKELTEAALKE